MTYQEALDYVWSLVNFETTPPETREPYHLGRMRALMARLGNPQERLAVVHVAGTKGKGSTSAMIERVLRAAGYRTALYTSPHLHDPRERLQVDGESISEEAFIGLVERLRPELEALGGITTFEALTAMGFIWFAESDVDIVVLEVGLGGRLDATNLVTPLVSVITSLALEHTPVLGDTIEEIAAEKAGIIKKGVPVVTSGQMSEALDVLRQVAAARQAPLTVAPEAWQARPTDISLNGQRFDVATRGGVEQLQKKRYLKLPLSLLGKHQIANAAVAIATLHLLREQGIEWDEAALRRGLAEVKWAARVEVLQREPLIIADGAHTEASAAALVETILEIVPQKWRHSTLIFGVSSNKDVSALIKTFEPLAEQVILTRARHPRAANPTDLALHPAFATHETRIIPNVAEAMGTALAEAGANDLIVVTGSLFAAAEGRAAVLGEDA